MEKNTVVIDLDGTLANLDHRLNLVKTDKPDWGEFYRRVSGDTINEWCKQLMLCLETSVYAPVVLVVTARTRSKQVIDDTLVWLIKNGIDDRFFCVFARQDQDDNRPDAEVKREWLRAYGKERILFVVDDRQRVVDMWREEGVTCLQCAAWKEHKRENKT